MDTVLIAGLVVMILLGLFPPWLYTLDTAEKPRWESAGYSLLFFPPCIVGTTQEGVSVEELSRKLRVKLNGLRLLLQWAVVAGILRVIEML